MKIAFLVNIIAHCYVANFSFVCYNFTSSHLFSIICVNKQFSLLINGWGYPDRIKGARNDACHTPTENTSHIINIHNKLTIYHIK